MPAIRRKERNGPGMVISEIWTMPALPSPSDTPGTSDRFETAGFTPPGAAQREQARRQISTTTDNQRGELMAGSLYIRETSLCSGVGPRKELSRHVRNQGRTVDPGAFGLQQLQTAMSAKILHSSQLA